MKRTAILATAIVLAACTSAQIERERLLVVQGVPVTAVVSDGQTCLEVGAEAELGRSCAGEEQSGSVWLGADTIRDGILVAGQAPAEVTSVVLIGDDGPRELMTEESGLGRFFIGVQLPPGDYEVKASRADGSTYVSGEMSLTRHGSTLTTITPDEAVP